MKTTTKLGFFIIRRLEDVLALEGEVVAVLDLAAVRLERVGVDELRAAAAAPDAVDLLRRVCLLYTSPSPRDQRGSRMPSSA